MTLSCKDGYKLAVLHAFFGHGYGYRSTCDSSLINQNCGSESAPSRARYLCQNKQKCVIRPTSEVLGSTSCKFGLDADLHIKYTCVNGEDCSSVLCSLLRRRVKARNVS